MTDKNKNIVKDAFDAVRFSKYMKDEWYKSDIWLDKVNERLLFANQTPTNKRGLNNMITRDPRFNT